MQGCGGIGSLSKVGQPLTFPVGVTHPRTTRRITVAMFFQETCLARGVTSPLHRRFLSCLESWSESGWSTAGSDLESLRDCTWLNLVSNFPGRVCSGVFPHPARVLAPSRTWSWDARQRYVACVEAVSGGARGNLPISGRDLSGSPRVSANNTGGQIHRKGVVRCDLTSLFCSVAHLHHWLFLTKGKSIQNGRRHVGRVASVAVDSPA